MMPSRTLRAVPGVLLGLSLVAQQGAPTPPGAPGSTPPPMPLALLLRDPEAHPVVGVAVTLRGRTTATLPALANVPQVQPFAAALGQPVALVGTSDARGFVRLRHDEAFGVLDGSGLLTTDQGLGALVADLHPSTPQRLDLQPMAALHGPEGTTLRVFARARLPHGRLLVLPPLHGERVLLPEAEYELWVDDGEAWQWLRLRLASGQSHALPHEPGRTRLVRCPPGTRLHPDDRPDVPLCENGGAVVLRDAAAAAPLWAWCQGEAFGPHVPSDHVAADQEPWPTIAGTPAAEHPPEPAKPTDGALLAVRRLGTQWQPLWIRRDDDTTWSTLPAPSAGDVWLVQVGASQAPLAQPWSTRSQRLAPGPAAAPLVGQVRDATGLPLGDVACEFEPDGMPAAAVRARSDGRGVLQFGLVQGPGTLRVVDPRYVNQAVDLIRIPKEPLPLVVLPGASLEGVARWPDGSVARGVIVTLRDPSGTLRPAERATPSAADGTFRFDGLPEQRGILLFAMAIRDGRTWSGRIERTLAGPGTVTIVLQDEDPVLGR